MGCTSSRLQRDFDESTSFIKLPLPSAATSLRTGAEIPFTKAKPLPSHRPAISSSSSWDTSSSTSSDAPQHPAFDYERARPYALMRKTSSRLRVVLDSDDVDATSPIVAKARMPFTPEDIRDKAVRRFESLARRDTLLPPDSNDQHDLARVISLGQMYMQIDRGSRDGELSDIEVEAMVTASEYAHGMRQYRGGKNSPVCGLARRNTKSGFRNIVRDILED